MAIISQYVYRGDRFSIIDVFLISEPNAFAKMQTKPVVWCVRWIWSVMEVFVTQNLRLVCNSCLWTECGCSGWEAEVQSITNLLKFYSVTTLLIKSHCGRERVELCGELRGTRGWRKREKLETSRMPGSSQRNQWRLEACRNVKEFHLHAFTPRLPSITLMIDTAVLGGGV